MFTCRGKLPTSNRVWQNQVWRKRKNHTWKEECICYMVRTLLESDISVICLVDLSSTYGFLCCHNTSLTLYNQCQYCWCTRSAVPGVRFLSNKERVFTLFKTCNFVKLAPTGGPLADYLAVYLHVILKMNHVTLNLVY